MGSAAPVTQNHLSKPEDLMLQNATPLKKSAPGPANISDEHVSCTAPATENASLQILFKCPTPAIVFGNAAKPSRFAVLTRCTIPCACHAKRRFNVQKRSEPLVFLTFWLRNVLRATTACAFSTSQLRKVVRRWGVLYILTSKCASRHNGLQFFISHLASCWLRTRFSEPTFRPSGATNHWKNTVFRDFPTVPFRAPGSSFFWDFLFFDIVSSSLLFSDSSHLCFSSVHIVGSLTSKLPSMICTYSLYSLSNFKAFVCVCVFVTLTPAQHMCIFFARVLRAQGGYIAKFATQRAAGSATAETERNLNKQNHAFLQIGQQF